MPVESYDPRFLDAVSEHITTVGALSSAKPVFDALITPGGVVGLLSGIEKISLSLDKEGKPDYSSVNIEGRAWVEKHSYSVEKGNVEVFIDSKGFPVNISSLDEYAHKHGDIAPRKVRAERFCLASPYFRWKAENTRQVFFMRNGEPSQDYRQDLLELSSASGYDLSEKELSLVFNTLDFCMREISDSLKRVS